ncbi:phenylacetate--CoA ligase family protein [candidate division CSSED10-310 bacterium]|uniref:Phenylacetate--CoA ligase family protein n=1 Tax=candidate division CSSED10-310 bacterium TaxID=2855610 RepID=A0ABV6YYK0_UNCC1
MNWRKPLICGLLSLSGSNILSHLKQIKTYEFSTRAVINNRRQEKLHQVLLHAYHHVPYYHRILSDNGVVVEGRVCLEKFSNLPILTKDIIRQEGSALYSRDHQQRKCYLNTSGGSTGEPVTIVQDKHYDEWNIATKLYFNEMLGKEIGDAEIKLWGSVRDILAGSTSLKDRVINHLYNRKLVNCYHLGEKELYELIDLNNRFKPVAYWSYMEAALELARFLALKPRKFYAPRFIISTGGPLSEEVKTQIEAHVGCRVFDQYGSREVGGIACQCLQQQGLHTFPWWNLIEIIDENERPVENGTGRILVTTFENYSMPLIRYEIGDVATAGGYTCDCGRASFQLNRILGRTIGYFQKADGSRAHSHFIVQAMYYKDWIKRFQIIQDAIDHLLIRIECSENREMSTPDLDDITTKTRILMGKQCAVDFEFVESIKRSWSGKFMYTICKIDNGHSCGKSYEE